MIINSVIIAFSMYSRIPMPKVEWNEKSMKYAFCFFPFIGIIIGIVIWLMGNLLINIRCNSLFFGCVMTVIPIFITGGIHFDGFLDTMDAINSYSDKEKKLVILKDSNSGAFAVIGGLVYFTLSIAFWSEANLDIINITSFGYVLSRAFSAISVICFPPAKKTGLAVTFRNNANSSFVKAVMIFFIVINCIIIGYINFAGAAAMFLTAILCFFYHYYNCVKNFGGITGDLAGYFLQVCELLFIIVNVILFKFII